MQILKMIKAELSVIFPLSFVSQKTNLVGAYLVL